MGRRQIAASTILMSVLCTILLTNYIEGDYNIVDYCIIFLSVIGGILVFNGFICIALLPGVIAYKTQNPYRIYITAMCLALPVFGWILGLTWAIWWWKCFNTND